MTAPVTLNAIATHVVGHYGNAAKSLVAVYRTGSKRALAASGSRYAKLVERTRLPLVGETDFACGRSMCRACERMARANRARA